MVWLESIEWDGICFRSKSFTFWVENGEVGAYTPGHRSCPTGSERGCFMEFSRDSHRILGGFSWGSHSSRSAVWDTVSLYAACCCCFGLRFWHSTFLQGSPSWRVWRSSSALGLPTWHVRCDPSAHGSLWASGTRLSKKEAVSLSPGFQLISPITQWALLVMVSLIIQSLW